MLGSGSSVNIFGKAILVIINVPIANNKRKMKT